MAVLRVLRVLRYASAAGLVLAAFSSVSVSAQGDAGQCIVAGRLSGGQWAPRFEAVQLRDQSGRVIARADKASLARVRQAELAQPALLSRCDGNAALARADDEPPQAKAEVPALSAGLVEVEAVAFPKLRTGGELVELKVRAPAERVVLVSR